MVGDRRSRFKHKNAPDYLSQHASVLIPLWLWTSDNPYLNPVDYKVWDVLQRQVYVLPYQDQQCRPQQRPVEEWHRFDHRIIKYAVRQWHVRLRACLHFEYTLYSCE